MTLDGDILWVSTAGLGLWEINLTTGAFTPTGFPLHGQMDGLAWYGNDLVVGLMGTLVQRLVSKDTTLLQVSGAQERLQQDCLATLFETSKKLATWSTLVRLLELESGTSLQMIGKIQ